MREMADHASTMLSTGVRHDVLNKKHKTPDLSIEGFELLHLDSNQGQRD